MFDVWLALALAGFAKPIWRWLRRERAEAWPSTQGLVESTSINESNWFRPRASSSPSVAIFRYSYDVGGTAYVGRYRKEFGTDEESEDFLRGLTGRHLRVQYNPRRAARSFVLDSSIDGLLSSRPPSEASPLEIHHYWNPLPLWLVRVLPVVNALAIAGFLLSVWVNVGAITGRWTPPSYFWALHIGIFLVFGPAVFVAQKRVGHTNRKDFWKVALRGAPDWMRYFLYAVFAYTAAIGIPSLIGGLQQPSGPQRSSDFISDWAGFSATWMAFYWASFTIVYAALEQERLGPRCVKGHPTHPDANFCSRCGQPVVRS
jgi:Protein of unknown function (DUF3592)